MTGQPTLVVNVSLTGAERDYDVHVHLFDRPFRLLRVGTRGDIVAVPATIAFDDLVAAFADAEHSRLPVTGGSLDEVIGMIHIKDVFKAQFDPSRPAAVDDTQQLPTAPTSAIPVTPPATRSRWTTTHGNRACRSTST